MSARIRRPSLLGGLLWTGLGVLFLLRNFSIGPDLWRMAARYWPILLILLGLGKVIDYFRQKEGVSIRFGEVLGILFLLIIGTAITKISNSNFGHVISELPIEIGGSSVHPGRWIGTSYSYTEESSYPISPGTALQIENSYGQVALSPGSDGEVRVRLRKVVYQNEEARAKMIAGEIKLEAGPANKAEPEGAVKPEAEPATKVKPEAEPAAKAKPEPVFVVRTNRDDLSSKDYRFNTEMEVFVPAKARITVRNSFGEVRAANLDGNLDLSTSHNPLEVHDCTGSVIAANKYAETRLVNITGSTTVDARGRVYLETVKGDVNVRSEFAPIEIRDVDGKVTVSDTDSSVTVEKASKAVVIEAPGCQVTARNLSDSLKVATGHKRLQVVDVASNVSVDTRYASISLKEIKGNVDISSNTDRINLDTIGGSLKIKADGSGVQANTVGGPVEIFTTRKDVAVSNFNNGCNITDEYGNVTLSTDTLGKNGLTVKNRNGDIQLYLPENAAFQIEAVARNGRVDSDIPGLEPVQAPGDVGTLKGKFKSGGPKIVLDTEYSNIHLRTRGSEEGDKPVEEEKPVRPARRSV